MDLLPSRSGGEDPGQLQEEPQPGCVGLPAAGHDPGCGEAGVDRQAAAQAAGRGAQGARLLPDGPLPRHPGGLPHPETVGSLAQSVLALASSRDGGKLAQS